MGQNIADARERKLSDIFFTYYDLYAYAPISSHCPIFQSLHAFYIQHKLIILKALPAISKHELQCHHNGGCARHLLSHRE